MSLGQLILYGVGTTVGAGIYALVGTIAGTAGYLAPWSFLTAALLALLTAMSFAVLSARYPRTAGIALYVQLGFGSTRIARIAGLLAIAAGLISCAALLNGVVGYLQEFVPLARFWTIVLVCLGIGGLASWGIQQAVWVAGTITVLEVGGLLWAIGVANHAAWAQPFNLQAFMPDDVWLAAPAVLSGAVLAFYAYIGFEDMVEMAEEVRNVRHNLPRAIMATLLISTVLYVALIASALLVATPATLAASSAPLADIFRAAGHNNPALISAIGLLAILNGALIQIIMVSRVLYGLAQRGQAPRFLAGIHPMTRTPVQATLLATCAVLFLALSGSVEQLAEITSVVVLLLFTLVNSSLVAMEWRKGQVATDKSPVRHSAAVAAIICTALVVLTATRWLAQLTG